MKSSFSTTGFWVLQLLAVLGIMSMMTASRGPLDEQGRARALAAAENHVRAAVTHARELARVTRSEHGVVFDAIGDRLALVQHGGTLAVDASGGTYQVYFGRGDLLGEVDILGADFGPKGPVVVFDGHGDALCGGSLTLRVGGRDKVLVLDGTTGDFVDG